MIRKASERVVRFSLTERIFHWTMALPYLLLLGTGGLLLVERHFSREFVSIELLVDLHRYAGLTLPIGLFLVFLGGDRRVLLENAGLALRWGVSDVKWLALAPVANFLEIALPKAGKFNPGQKVNLLLQMILIPVFAITGVWIWIVGGALLPWYVHVAAFAVATPLVAGHLFLALVHPDTRTGLNGVFFGHVDAHWARHHYPLQYPSTVDSCDDRPAAITRDDPLRAKEPRTVAGKTKVSAG